MMATKTSVLDMARAELGTVENPAGSNKTKYCEWYGITGPWCAMFVSWVFFHAGLPLPATTEKGFAWTPSGARYFKNLSKWGSSPVPGAVVFFDFPNDGVNRISHVGIVEHVNADGSIVTIEGNTDEAGGRTGGKVMRKTRRSGIVGYGYPDYEDAAQPAPTPAPQPVPQPTPTPHTHRTGTGWFNGNHPTVAKGAGLRGPINHTVIHVQSLANHYHGAGLAADGRFGDATHRWVTSFQRAKGLGVDGIVGDETFSVLHPVIQKGSNGFPVQEAQRELGVGDDGDFGPVTEAALKDYQSHHGLSSDGAAGRQTYGRMLRG